MRLRPDLAPQRNSELRIIQLTDDPDVPSSHIYMESQVFTPDSRFVVFRRGGHPHGAFKDDPHHRLMLCDLHNPGELMPMTDELGVTGPCIAPDGSYLYYFVNEADVNRGRLLLKRVRLDGTERETLVVLDKPLPGAKAIASRPYSLSTISSCGTKIATSAFLGDGRMEPPHYGLIIFDVVGGGAELVLSGPTWGNMHPQYSRSLDPEASRDILIQENHGRILRPTGESMGDRWDPLGADIHVIRDDGSNFRTMPWGRDGNEQCQGHQCWVGRSEWAITSTSTRDVGEQQLIASLAAPYAGHAGKNTPDGVRTDLSGNFTRPDFYHFATDLSGRRLITDSGIRDEGGGIYVATLSDPPDEPIDAFHLLLRPRSSWQKNSHIHPCFTPDGKTALFNSDETGTLQAYAVTGFELTV